jgi:hypothetical protein
MTRDREHPGEELFEHLNGSLNVDAVKAVEVHIAECDECRLATDIIKMLKAEARPAGTIGSGRTGLMNTEVGTTTRQSEPVEGSEPAKLVEPSEHDAARDRSNPSGRTRHRSSLRLTLRDVDGTDKPEVPQLSNEMLPALYQHPASYQFEDEASGHPDTGELACFFYDRAVSNEADLTGCVGSASAAVAAHLALCRECARYLSDFARAELAALSASGDQSADAAVNPTAAPSLGKGISAQAWKMIADWEDSELAIPKAECEVLDCKTVEMMLKILSERRKEIYEMAQRDILRCAERAAVSEVVPVIVLDQQGSLQGVQLFRNVKYEKGAQVLTSFMGPDRFENKMVHALLDYGLPNVLVASNRLSGGVVRIPIPGPQDRQLRQTDYFIIEGEPEN